MTTEAALGEPEVRIADADDEITVVSLLGEHDLATAAEVRSALGALLDRASIVVDLSETEFVDSSTIYALVDGRMLASEHGSRMSFQVQAGSAVQRVLETCGLLKVWPVCTSRDEAIATLRPPRLVQPVRVRSEAPAIAAVTRSSRSLAAAGRRRLHASPAGKPRLVRKPRSRLEVR